MTWLLYTLVGFALFAAVVAWIVGGMLVAEKLHRRHGEVGLVVGLAVVFAPLFAVLWAVLGASLFGEFG